MWSIQLLCIKNSSCLPKSALSAKDPLPGVRNGRKFGRKLSIAAINAGWTKSTDERGYPHFSTSAFWKASSLESAKPRLINRSTTLFQSIPFHKQRLVIHRASMLAIGWVVLAFQAHTPRFLLKKSRLGKLVKTIDKMPKEKQTNFFRLQILTWKGKDKK